MKRFLIITFATTFLAACSKQGNTPESKTSEATLPAVKQAEPIKEQKYEGSAFIVAKDGNAHKLALMEVKFILEDEFDRYIESNTNKIKVALLQRLDAVKGAEQERQQFLSELWKTRESLSKYTDDLDSKSERDLTKIHEDLVRSLNDRNHETAMKMIGVGASSSQMKEFQERHEKKMERIESEWKTEKETRAKEREDKKREREEKDRELKQLAENRDKTEAAAELGGIDAKFRALMLTLGDTIDTNIFASLPAPFVSTKTDADGKFSMSVASDRKCVLAARAQRQVGEKIEIYHWLIRLRPTNVNPLFLSNDNLFVAKSSESAVELLPLDLGANLKVDAP